MGEGELSSTVTGVPRRGRRRTGPRQGDVRELALLESAESVLGDRPLSEVTIEAIASGAGLSRPAVYFYFDGKDAIVDAVIGRVTQELISGIAALVASGEPMDVVVRRMVEATFEAWRRRGGVFRAAIEIAARDAERGSMWQDVNNRCAELVVEAVERDRERGLLPHRGDARTLATTLVWMVERNCHHLFSREHTAEEEQALFDTLVLVGRRGLGIPDD
ncbi:TetR/AcrR family transcriptional regulator [Allostreptomyces psammosilenae]|uniref:AcrR family transcriptional regulator n=1 Tax=Allostreptomyces psammosilenae TaxID=1892865 RepID=A0A853A5U4_9ACTN|nr:TetR/AcrR family transcriptional regulator [Allostreptomyces psammosilenae]NYI08214.1 AcrR family transcriptional regulator [Allostreptomyces psammosilenae]